MSIPPREFDRQLCPYCQKIVEPLVHRCKQKPAWVRKSEAAINCNSLDKRPTPQKN